MIGPLIIAGLMPVLIVAISYACRRRRGQPAPGPADVAGAWPDERAQWSDAEPQPRETVAFDRGAYAVGESDHTRVPAKGDPG